MTRMNAHSARCAVLLAACLLPCGCKQSAPPDAANNARWQNYLQEHARQSSSASADYQRRQAQLAAKQNGTDKGGEKTPSGPDAAQPAPKSTP